MGNEHSEKILPAQKVGGMRVKAPNDHRVPLKAEDKEEHHAEQEEEETDETKQAEFEHDRSLREMQAEQMRGQSPSMNAYNPKNNAGSMMGRGPNYNPSFQQRSMNH
ncbi:hypothetical protein BDB00DRAFT_827974 [Zychaea mexicana]|uniref:uncharacterized protein n=1 Tax=Zychaea mexicana TaxID=64656 RepID=UPI0022FF21D3|nr:uncharacterized protein BDB00DRAFT_827974 [Zychaea mexicana]KAI9492565.1 hypothetical protein BDB00DRAFT_827974 [Zychaea mexicana]